MCRESHAPQAKFFEHSRCLRHRKTVENLGFLGVERPSGGRKTGGSRVRSAGPTTEDESYVPQVKLMCAAGEIFLA